MKDLIKKRVGLHIEMCENILGNKEVLKKIHFISDAIIESLKNGKKILFAGNGGSAADAQHLAAEFSGRFMFDREPLDAEALHCNTSYLTAVGNDYSYDEIFSRLIKAKAKEGDVLIGLSTSGKSNNVVKALEESKKRGVHTFSFIGDHDSTPMESNSDVTVKIPAKDTARIQEGYMILGHIICEHVEQEMFKNE